MRSLRTTAPRQHVAAGRAGLRIVRPPDDRIVQRVRTDRPLHDVQDNGRPWCRACARWQAECSRCGKLAAIRVGTRQGPLCASCAVPDQGFWKASRPAAPAGACWPGSAAAASWAAQLGELLADPGRQIRAELQVLHDTLASAGRADTVLNWLKRDCTGTVLTELAVGQRPQPRRPR
jgi:hypothetical protein